MPGTEEHGIKEEVNKAGAFCILAPTKMVVDAHDIPDAIQWHEGLLLTPQHFQQLSLRHEALVQYGTSLVAPFCWGIRRFKHDAIELPPGKLIVLELEGIMPDGLVVSHGLHSTGRDNPLAVDLKDLPITDRGLLVHLAVPARKCADSNGDLSRYESFKGNPVADETPGGTPREIHRIKPRLSLHVGETVSPNYLSFPLARVIYKKSAYALDDKFIPPVLTVPVQSAPGEASSEAAQRLGLMCSTAAQEVRKRAMVLADAARDQSTGGRLRDDLATRNLLLSLVASLPYYEAVLKTGVAHPYMVYLALCSMAGQLAAMRTEMVPPSFDPYRHDDLYWTFRQVLDFIHSALNQGVPVSYAAFPFQYRDDREGGRYELLFDPSWAGKRLALAFKGQRASSESDVIRWGQNCLIASEDRIDALRKNRMFGVEREHVSRVGDVVPTGGFVLFSLTVDDKQGGGSSFIKIDQMLQILNHDGIRPAEIVLYVLDNPSTSGAV